MPVVLRYNSYRFFFFSNEGEQREPAHIHVRLGESIAKFWLLPEIRLPIIMVSQRGNSENSMV